MEVYDFGGYATKVGLKCADGRVIRQDAFKDQDGVQVPLVWNHAHSEPGNVLGHGILENRPDGVYFYGKFNDSAAGKNAKILVQHGDIESLSIYANDLVQKGFDVCHGVIREVSLVLAGANPGALIDDISIEHGYEGDSAEAVIYTGLPLDDSESFSHADDGEEDDEDETVADVIESLTDKQKDAVYYVLGSLMAEDMASEVKHSATKEGEGDKVKKNVFDGSATKTDTPTLTHAQFSAIVEDTKNYGGSFRKSFMAHAQEYGIENIELLFPDARNVTNPPDWIKRRTEWVAGVLNGCRHSPFSRIKSMAADITADEARARGYTKGNRKKEEVFKLLQRKTGPTTIYKKQKLDRDDIIDITDLDVVSWIMGEMRIMLDEEIARAVMIGDGRPVMKEDGSPNEDKIDEECIRPIWKEDELYAPRLQLPKGSTLEAQMEAVLRAMDDYEGSGSPTLYTYQGKVTDWRLQRDKIGRLLYESDAAVANAMGVDRISKIPLMKDVTRYDEEAKKTYRLVAIIVNLRDYTIGADKGGQITKFEDFDIDYNQYKYLLETRMSGCLTHPKSALIVEEEIDTPTPSKPSETVG